MTNEVLCSAPGTMWRGWQGFTSGCQFKGRLNPGSLMGELGLEPILTLYVVCLMSDEVRERYILYYIE